MALGIRRFEASGSELTTSRRDPHAAIVLGAEASGDVVEIGHGADVDPGLRHRDHDIGGAETEAVDHEHALLGVGNAFAHEVFAGDAEMHRAAREIRRDFARREIGDLDIVEAGNGAAVVARAAGFRQHQAGAGEEGLGIFLQPPLGGDGENERDAHALPPFLPALTSASTQIEKPTAGIGSREPSCVISPS